jgi:ribonuclease P protein component
MLKGRPNFRRVITRGSMRRSDGLAVYACPGEQDAGAFGIVVTTRVGTAVRRNRVRRWARELLRRWQGHLTAGHDLVVLANRPEAGEGYSHFAEHFARALAGLGVAEAPLDC